MKLYFAHFSPPARTALMTIRSLGLDVELKHVDFQQGDNKTDEFAKLNPLHQVPVLIDDDGFVLTESRAIAAYLVSSRRPDSPLYPTDPVKRAIVDQRLYYDATVVFQSHIDILVRTVDEGFLLLLSFSFLAQHPMVRSGDPQIPVAKKEHMKKVLSTLDSFLDGFDWMAGEQPTLADLSILSNLIVIVVMDLKGRRKMR